MSWPIPPVDLQLILPVDTAVAWRAVTDHEGYWSGCLEDLRDLLGGA